MANGEIQKKKIDIGERLDLAIGGIWAAIVICALAFIWLHHESSKTKDAQPSSQVETTSVQTEIESTPIPPKEREVPEVVVPEAPKGAEGTQEAKPTPDASITRVVSAPGCQSDSCLVAPRSGGRTSSCGVPVLNLVPPGTPRSVTDKFISETLTKICPIDGSALADHYKDREHQQSGVLQYPDGTEVSITWFIK